MPQPVHTWLTVCAGAAAIAACWAAVWSVPALALRRNDIADVAWGLTYPVLALLTGGIVVAPDWHDYPRAGVATVLSLVWGVRLATHIGRRALAHDGEDKRYAALRRRMGRQWPWRSVLQVFVLQAVIALVVAQPLLIAAAVHEGRSRLGWLDALGIAVFVVGFLLEAIADRQLGRFMARKQAGEVEGYLTTGVWSWSRHPNYAGDAILWWGLGLLGIAGALDADAPWLVVPAAVGPVVMTLFLRYGSGVPMTEKGRAGTPAWDAYVERTSPFLPRPPRRAGRPA
ncbi:MAG: hypothetical protein JWM98_2242 [Thermoleophilia bacterium]|nr:hypothetical protein [Thermoleophilia bacterium]